MSINSILSKNLIKNQIKFHKKRFFHSNKLKYNKESHQMHNQKIIFLLIKCYCSIKWASPVKQIPSIKIQLVVSFQSGQLHFDMWVHSSKDLRTELCEPHTFLDINEIFVYIIHSRCNKDLWKESEIDTNVQRIG